MRDLLPEEAKARRAIARALLDRFALHGYGLVTPPAFEFADVLERGLGTRGPSDVLRFVEPESGEVAALRPDMTPQIARMIATRLRARPAPFRLCYEGTVMRRRSSRARKHRQIPQVGVELAGAPASAGDLELLVVVTSALQATGLARFTLELGDSGIVRGLLGEAPPHVVETITEALTRKDEGDLAARAREAGLTHGALLVALARLHGGPEALDAGARLLASTPAAAAVARLRELFEAARTQGLADRLTVDLAEVRGFSYYTGALFHLYAAGPGEAVGSGGRYDELLARFGAPMPAVGFGIDLDSLAWALRTGGAAGAREARVIVVGPVDDARVVVLRRAGIAAVAAPDREGALAYARAWGFTGVVDRERVIDPATGAEAPSPFAAGDAAAAQFFGKGA
jgi:ATP phosphoribosyltransferase regulatory subunit